MTITPGYDSLANGIGAMKDAIHRWNEEQPKWEEGGMLIETYRALSTIEAMLHRGDLMMTKPPGFPALVVAYYEDNDDAWRVAEFDNEGRKISDHGRFERAEHTLNSVRATMVAPTWAVEGEAIHALRSLPFPAQDWIPNALVILAAHGRCLNTR